MVIPIRDDLPTMSKPILTIAIIAACIYIYGFVQPHGADREVEFLAQHAAIPCEVVHAKPISNELSQACDGQLHIPGEPATSPAEPFPHKNVFLAIVVSSATLSGDEPTEHAADFVGPSLAGLADGIIGSLTA